MEIPAEELKKLISIYKQDLEVIKKQRAEVAIKIAEKADVDVKIRMRFSELDGMHHYIQDIISRLEGIIKKYDTNSS